MHTSYLNTCLPLLCAVSTRTAILQNTRVVEGLVGTVAQGTLAADDAAIEANHAETAAEEARVAALRAATYAEAARLMVRVPN